MNSPATRTRRRVRNIRPSVTDECPLEARRSARNDHDCPTAAGTLTGDPAVVGLDGAAGLKSIELMAIGTEARDKLPAQNEPAMPRRVTAVVIGSSRYAVAESNEQGRV